MSRNFEEYMDDYEERQHTLIAKFYGQLNFKFTALSIMFEAITKLTNFYRYNYMSAGTPLLKMVGLKFLKLFNLPFWGLELYTIAHYIMWLEAQVEDSTLSAFVETIDDLDI